MSIPNTAQGMNAEQELNAHRKYLEAITDGGRDYPEDFDILVDLGLVVPVKASLDFLLEWGDTTMYVLAWDACHFDPPVDMTEEELEAEYAAKEKDDA